MKSSKTIEMQHQVCDRQWHCVSLCYQIELKQKIQVVILLKQLILGDNHYYIIMIIVLYCLSLVINETK